MKYLSNKSEEIIRNLVKAVLEMEIENQGFSELDIFESRASISNLVVDVVNEKIAEKCVAVQFDSPMGSDSRHICLASKDLIVDSGWSGSIGTRGRCRILVRKKDFKSLDHLTSYLRTLKDKAGNEYVDCQSEFEITLGEF